MDSIQIILAHYMKILGAFLTDFHKHKGLRLVVSDPVETPLTPQQFKLYSGLIQPRKELCDRILTIQFLDEYYLVVCPQLSNSREWDEKITYDRANFIYSASILVGKSQFLKKGQQALYKEAVSKLARFFRVMQEMHQIIYNDEHPEYIRSILRHFRQQMNGRGQCDLSHLCSHYTFINASSAPFHQLPPSITSATVPVTILSQQQIGAVESELGQQLLRYALDGTSTFRKICRLHRDRKEGELKDFYLKGCEKGVVFLLDLLSLNNCYTLTPAIRDYLPDQTRHAQLASLARAVASKEQAVDSQQLLCLYLQFNRVTSLHKIVQLNRKLIARIDVQKLVRFGQICGFLRRVHQKIMYMQFPQPLIMAEPMKKLLQQRGSDAGERAVREESDKLADMVRNDIMSGLTVDEIMVNLDVDYERLMRLLNAQNRYVLKVSSPQ